MRIFSYKILLGLGVGVLLLVTLCTTAYAQTQVLNFRVAQYNYKTETRYTKVGVLQDTIYLVAAAPNTPQHLKGWRKDKQSTTFKLSKLEVADWTKTFKPILGAVQTSVEADFVVQEPGAYQLEIVDGGTTIRRILWLFYDDIALQSVRAINKCDGLTLYPVFNYDFDAIRYDKFLYYDLSVEDDLLHLQEVGTKYFKEVNWFDLKNNPVEVYGIIPRPITPPPYKKGGYKVKITTSSGRQFEATTEDLTPVAVLAKMKIEINKDLDGISEQWQDGGEKPQGEMPFYMRLTNASENATVLHWTVQNDLRAVRRGGADTLFYEKTGASSGEYVQPSHEIFTAGVYRAVLRAVNEQTGCEDSMLVNVQVDSALLAKTSIPNVFSPNGDGINDVFQIIEKAKNAKSLKHFEVRIMNRGGALVYEYRGDVRKWEGWNGRKNGKGNLLPVGVYFYVIRAVGWDGTEFAGKEYKGILQLYR